uniref:HDGE_amylase domain-containing protein n=1 Tax=Mesocestoides corti TaxID=53468 RepID=A0A5K3FT75_MESCO
MTKNKDFLLYGGQGFFVVESRFCIGSPEDLDRFSQWDLEGVVMQTYIAKNLGSFSEWRDRLRVAYETGYNMIHFTPLQELGVSSSGYSVKDQLVVNPKFSEEGLIKKIGWEEIEDLVKEMETEWSVLSMTDLVLNHTAVDSPWIQEHTECVYNLENSPHLVPAFIVDYVVWRMSQDCAEGKLVHKHIPPGFSHSDTHMAAVRNYLVDELKQLKLHEFFQADIAVVSEEFKQWLASGEEEAPYVGKDNALTLRIVGSRAGHRFGATVDFQLAKEIFGHDTPDVAAHNLHARLTDMNRNIEETTMHNLWCAVDCVVSGTRYRFFDPSGPLLGTVTETTPLVEPYFLFPKENLNTVADAENLALSDQAKYVMACNGWVMNANPLKNFADVDSNVYFRRELIVWADSVKLRYGDKPEDSPYLWDRMLEYSRMTAKIFHGVRLDNCHSTPLHVAQAMLDACRDVRPNIYVVAELFTGDEGTDNIYLNKLGISSLVREALSAYDCHDQGRMVHRFGGMHPAGGFPHAILKRRVTPSLPHAIFYDQTHDNPSPAVKRTVFDYLPSSALVTMSACSVASVRGYDELVPYQIDVVNETRPYASWFQQINIATGMLRAKNALNKLHRWMAANNFHETFVDQVDTNVIAVTRLSVDTAESIVMVTHSCFFDRSPHPGHTGFRRIVVNGRVRRILIEARTVNHALGNPMDEFKRSDSVSLLPTKNHP